MPKLHIRPASGRGRLASVTPENAGWSYVGFELHRLAAGEALTGGLADREACLVLISGTADIAAGADKFGVIGERLSPFDGPPHSVYAPAACAWRAVPRTELTLAVCTAPGTPGARPPRLIGPESVGRETRGKGSNVRHVANILPEWEPADSLLVVEVITPGGNTSSYPPHKHDRDALPEESLLEETYYHRLNPPQGFGFQRVYTDDRSLDEAMVIEDGDITLVPRGYHPCAAIHGYDLYYLNVMAGPRRTWKFFNAPEHAWLLAG